FRRAIAWRESGTICGVRIFAPRPVKNHYPALPLERLSELLGRIGDYQQGRELTRLAEVLTLHLFIRSSELRFARWSEIDFR
ncbi:hypothetical protein ACUOFC_63270, partial [Escherichia sp. TWPC-MK]